jgi:hypothetical protein
MASSKKDANGRPTISNVTPEAAIPGGEFQIHGAGLARSERPRVTIGDVAAPIVIGSDSYIIVRVPEGASAGELVIEAGSGQPGRRFVRQCFCHVQRVARPEDARFGL